MSIHVKLPSQEDESFVHTWGSGPDHQGQLISSWTVLDWVTELRHKNFGTNFEKFH